MLATANGPSFSELKCYSKIICKNVKITLDKSIPKCYTIIVKREVPTRDTKMGDEVHRVKKVRKKKNSLLTNSKRCATISTERER